jgi:FHA domain
MASGPRLVWLDRSAAAVPLAGGTPLTIGRDPANRLCLAAEAGLSRHHAELRPTGEGQWLVCDLGSSNGTYVEGERLSGCRTLAPGDRIRLGRRGALLQFLVGAAPETAAPQPAPFASDAESVPLRSAPPSAQTIPSQPPFRSASPRDRPASPAGAVPQPAPPNPGVLPGSITVAGRPIPLEQICGVEVHSQALHPHVFSWWLPAWLGGLLLLPFPLLFWPWQAAALAVAILLGRRREHTLILTLRDGRAHRHAFADRPTALAHGQGVRRALGQVQGPAP